MCVCVTQPKTHPEHTFTCSAQRTDAVSAGTCWRERRCYTNSSYTKQEQAFQIHSLTSFIINWVIVCYQPHAELHSDSLYFLFHRRLYESTITGLTGLMAEQYNKKNLWALRLFNCSAEWKLTGAVDHKQGKYVDEGGRLNQQVQQQRFIAVRTKAFP